jgi:2-amino-4-hydroxy-6-hydroxymethyldihydropteridine diphosphokinase
VAVVYIALGSNLGERLELLRGAVEGLVAGGVEVVARSGVYETEAVAAEPQPPYLNAVVRGETALGAPQTLELCLAVEVALGRVRPAGRTGASRTIDLDLLLYDSVILDQPGLSVPHPRLLERAFVRVPLADVAAPGLRHPQTGERLDEPRDLRRFASL